MQPKIIFKITISSWGNRCDELQVELARILTFLSPGLFAGNSPPHRLSVPLSIVYGWKKCHLLLACAEQRQARPEVGTTAQKELGEGQGPAGGVLGFIQGLLRCDLWGSGLPCRGWIRWWWSG